MRRISVAVADGDRAVVGLRRGAVGVLGGAVRGHLVLAAAVAGGEPDVAALDVDDRVGGRDAPGRARAPPPRTRRPEPRRLREGWGASSWRGTLPSGPSPSLPVNPTAGCGEIVSVYPAAPMARDWTELFLTDGPVPAAAAGRGDARAAPRLLPPPAREHAQDARGARRRGPGHAVRGRPRRGDLGAPRGGADLRRRRRAHDRAGRRAARARGGGGRPRRRRAADRAAGRAARAARAHGRRHDRHPARADRDPRRRRQRHRQDDHDRQARLAPAATRSARPS